MTLLSFLVLWMLKVTRVVKINVGFRKIVRNRVDPKLVRALFSAALFEPVLYMLFETAGIAQTTNVTAAVVLSLAPIASCVIEAIVLREKNSPLQKLFLGLGIAGVMFIAVNTDTKNGTGQSDGDFVAGGGHYRRRDVRRLLTAGVRYIFANGDHLRFLYAGSNRIQHHQRGTPSVQRRYPVLLFALLLD